MRLRTPPHNRLGSLNSERVNFHVFGLGSLPAIQAPPSVVVNFGVHLGRSRQNNRTSDHFYGTSPMGHALPAQTNIPFATGVAAYNITEPPSSRDASMQKDSI